MQLVGKINAGRRIHSSRRRSDGEGHVVLAHNADNCQPWVTWRTVDGTSFFWGHYHSSATAAINDLLERADGVTNSDSFSEVLEEMLTDEGLNRLLADIEKGGA